MIQVRGERVLSGNRMKRKRLSDQKKQEVKNVKRFKQNAQESQRGHQNRQNTEKGTRKRTRKDTSKKANIQRRATREGNTKKLLKIKQTQKRSSTERSELQRIRERRGGKSCLIWVFSNAKAQKNSNLFYQSSFDTSFSL